MHRSAVTFRPTGSGVAPRPSPGNRATGPGRRSGSVVNMRPDQCGWSDEARAGRRGGSSSTDTGLGTGGGDPLTLVMTPACHFAVALGEYSFSSNGLTWTRRPGSAALRSMVYQPLWRLPPSCLAALNAHIRGGGPAWMYPEGIRSPADGVLTKASLKGNLD